MVRVPQKQSYTLLYAPLFRVHLKSIEPKYYSRIRAQIETQLFFEPHVETRNRKPLKRPIVFEAQWELRFGPQNRFRVFYKIVGDLNQVYILTIGEKKGNKLFIGGEEIEL